jgi:hypothetical protein
MYRPLVLNVNLLCNVFFFFNSCLKRVNKKGKQKEKDIMFFFLFLIQLKIQILANLFIDTRIRNITPFGFVQYLSTSELKIFIGKCSLMLKSGTL